MGGMITSATRELTIFPKATPMITPTARSTTLPRMANSRNSLKIATGASLPRAGSPAPRPLYAGRPRGGAKLPAAEVTA